MSVSRLDLEAVSVNYRIPASTLRRWISEGRLTAYRRRPTMLELDEVDRVIAAIGKRRLDKGEHSV